MLCIRLANHCWSDALFAIYLSVERDPSGGRVVYNFEYCLPSRHSAMNLPDRDCSPLSAQSGSPLLMNLGILLN
jgi:hypothetical protein